MKALALACSAPLAVSVVGDVIHGPQPLVIEGQTIHGHPIIGDCHRIYRGCRIILPKGAALFQRSTLGDAPVEFIGCMVECV